MRRPLGYPYVRANASSSVDAKFVGAGYSLSVCDKLYGYTLIAHPVCVAAFGGRALVLTHEAAPFKISSARLRPFGLRSLSRSSVCAR